MLQEKLRDSKFLCSCPPPSAVPFKKHSHENDENLSGSVTRFTCLLLQSAEKTPHRREKQRMGRPSVC